MRSHLLQALEEKMAHRTRHVMTPARVPEHSHLWMKMTTPGKQFHLGVCGAIRQEKCTSGT